MVVEDEQILLEVLQKKLSQNGFTVLAAKDGDEGLAKIREHRPDLVLLDIVMPKKDGFEVLREIQRDKNLKNIPVIIISNSGQNVEIEKAKKMGVRDYLVKTQFDPAEVLAKVNRQFGLSGATAAPSSDPIAVTAEKTSGQAAAAKTILIIEDDNFLRNLMVKKLTDEGYAVSEAFDGQVGLKKVITDKPVLVLLDLILPGIDGFKLLEEIKSNPATADIPVIILSNLGQKEDIDRGLQLGAVDFMIKAHFTPNEIVGKIKNVLKGS